MRPHTHTITHWSHNIEPAFIGVIERSAQSIDAAGRISIVGDFHKTLLADLRAVRIERVDSKVFRLNSDDYAEYCR